MTALVNGNHHAIVVLGRRYRAGEVMEAHGTLQQELEATRGVREATVEDERAWTESREYRRPRNIQPPVQSGSISSDDVARLGVLEKAREAKRQEVTTSEGGNPVVTESTPAGNTAKDLDLMDPEQLAAFAAGEGIDIGRSTSRNGILTKIREAQAERAAAVGGDDNTTEGEADADNQAPPAG